MAHPPTDHASTPPSYIQPAPPKRAIKTRYQKEEEAMGGPIVRRTDIDGHGHWRFGRMIGKGASGRVKLAQHELTQQLAAVKIVPKSAILSSRLSLSACAEGAEKEERLLMAIEREIVVMKLIDHPHLVKLLDVFDTETDMYMILEYVPNGELFDHICARGRLPPTEALHYFRQIMRGVDYCHRFNIAHRDLKPENLLLDDNMNVKIADFGMATFQKEETLLETSCGSPHYAAPEIVAGKPYHGCASDIWSCGVILYALLTGRLPFDDPNIRILLKKVKEGKFGMPMDLPIEAQDLMRRMMQVDVDKRIKMEDILRHPFFVLPNPPLSILPPVPTAPTRSELSRPLYPTSTSGLNMVRTMKALWRNRDEDDIMQALLTDDGNWEKVFYFLLCKYQERTVAMNSVTKDASMEGGETPTPTKDDPHPVSPRAGRTLRDTPTPAPRGPAVHVPKRLPTDSPASQTSSPAVKLSLPAEPAPARAPSPRSFLPMLSENAMEVDSWVAPVVDSPPTSSAMDVDPTLLRGSEGVSSDTRDEEEVDEIVFDIGPAYTTSTPRSDKEGLDLSLPPIEKYMPFAEELLGLGIAFSQASVLGEKDGVPADSSATPTSATKTLDHSAAEAAVKAAHPNLSVESANPPTLPTTVMGLRVPKVRRDDLAMQDFFRELKRKSEDTVRGPKSVPKVATRSTSKNATTKGDSNEWVRVSPPTITSPTLGDQSRKVAATYRRRSAAPYEASHRPTSIPLPLPNPSREPRAQRPARITFSPELAPRAEVEYRPSSSHLRRMTVSTYSVESTVGRDTDALPRAVDRTARRPTLVHMDDKENQEQDRFARSGTTKERRNTAGGLGLPSIKRESERRVNDSAMRLPFSGMSLTREHTTKANGVKQRQGQPAGALNVNTAPAQVPLPAPYMMHPHAAHFHANVLQALNHQPTPFFLPPQMQSPPIGLPSHMAYAYPQPQSPPLSAASSDNKTSWFSSLFAWKGDKCELTSDMGVAETRAECQRLLSWMEVFTLFEEVGSGSTEWGLKCWTSSAPNSPWYKPVRFSISFASTASHTLTPPSSTPLLTPITPPSIGSSPNPSHVPNLRTTVTLTLDKGSVSTFRAVYARLRSEWSGSGGLRSPELRSPELAPVAVMGPGGWNMIHSVDS